jgi:hypothetical protein
MIAYCFKGFVMDSFYLALVETASNQAYIFQSNKLREVLGASELVRQIGTVFAVEALKNCKGHHEPVVTTSGKAVVKFATKQDAEDFVFAVTSRALKEAPGLGVFGAVSEEIKAVDSAEALGKIMGCLFEKAAKNRLKLADPQARFPFQPIIMPCKTSGLPAAHPEQKNSTDTHGEISATAKGKRIAAKAAMARLEDLFGTGIAKSPEALEEDCDWLGVVHADGNGFGQIFLNLSQYCVGTNQKNYFDFYATLSRALDDIGLEATRIAANGLKPTKKGALPLVPLIMGGDDLTVIVDGKQALDFVRAYVATFENLVDNNDCIKGIAQRHNEKFGVGAGIAIVKPHHPFHRAYDLSEELIKSAKETKKTLGRGVSSFDFHVAFGDSSSDLKTLRQAWKIGNAKLTARPYVLSPARTTTGNAAWAERHSVTGLDAARAMLDKTTDRNGDKVPAFPRSQQHVLRDGLFEGKDATEARLDLIRHRYEDKDRGINFSVFGENSGLFYEDDKVFRTRLLDAMELNDVCGEPETELKAEEGDAK